MDVMTGNKIVIQLMFLGVLIIMAACAGCDREKGTRDTTSEGVTRAPIPVFNADSAYHFVAKQVSFGPRVPNTQAHREGGDWLEQTLGGFADTLYVQNAKVRAYDGTILNIRNIIGSFQPEKVNRILLCAHWDSRPWADHDPDPANHFTPIDGANDGASGVGVLLEIARQLSLSNPRVGVDILLLDAEDYGKHQSSQSPDMDSWALGSQHWSKYPHKYDYNARYGILLDMVGASNATFLHEGYSMMFAPNIVRKVWDIAAKQGYGSFFVNRDGGYIMDDHYYINTIRNIPVINIIDLRSDTPHGFYEHWHTIHDTMDAIDPATLKAVGQTLAAVLWQE
jgi:Zn-dependent M28 family amino/carboxypeptidase